MLPLAPREGRLPSRKLLYMSRWLRFARAEGPDHSAMPPSSPQMKGAALSYGTLDRGEAIAELVRKSPCICKNACREDAAVISVVHACMCAHCSRLEAVQAIF